MKKMLCAAQIGCGKFAHQQDLPNLSTHPLVHLKYACDVNIDNARATMAIGPLTLGGKLIMCIL